MGIFGDLSGIGTAVGGITDVIKDLIQLFPNAEQRQKAAEKIQDVELAIAQGQMTTNTAEASNASIFVSGWRPFIGWVCGFGFLYSIIQPGFHLPPVDMTNIIAILGGMLGLGTMRTAEKIAGVPPSIVKKITGK